MTKIGDFDVFPEDQPDSSGVYFFGKQKLEPLSFERSAAAVQLGRRRPAVVAEMLLVYCCLVTEDKIEEALWSPDTEKAFRREMFKWAEERGMTVRDENKGRQEIHTLAIRMWDDLAKVEFKAEFKTAEGNHDPNATG